ncbi:hypothetical protein MUTS16_67620 [Escherichia coli]|nr:hypothetical protein MUTS16_67620 [Escherichia coli]
MVIQEQQITGTKGMQNWKIYALTGAPELFYEWLGVEFAIKERNTATVCAITTGDKSSSG